MGGTKGNGGDRLFLSEIVSFKIDLKFVRWFDWLSTLLSYRLLHSIVLRFVHCRSQVEFVP
jgi:hypothetical protein